MARDLPARPSGLGRHGRVLLAIAVAFGGAWWYLHLDVRDLVPDPAHLAVAGRFFEAAVTPDFSSAVLSEAVKAVWQTIAFGVGAMSLALVGGTVLGFFASSAWWSTDVTGRPPSLPHRLIHGVVRVAIAVFRSVHELLWAVVFLVAMGAQTPLAGVVAIAIPYGCVLAKVFAELLDEAPLDAARALRTTGASSAQVFCFGLLPRALPDMAAYAFYRFECTLRSAAVLGFLGFETLGLFIQQAFGEGNYSTAWTFLYALIALVAVADWWSGAIRRSFAA